MDHRQRIGTITLVSLLCITGSLASEHVSIFSTSNFNSKQKLSKSLTLFYPYIRIVFASTEKQSTPSTSTTTTTSYPLSSSSSSSSSYPPTTIQQSTTQQQNTTTLPGTTSDLLPISLSPSIPSTVSISTASHADIVETPPDSILIEHEIIGSAGPDKKESEGIQRALDWLKEKRSADYGWENDTHMVILAKEVKSMDRI